MNTGTNVHSHTLQLPGATREEPVLSGHDFGEFAVDLAVALG
jgi:hypothetical protein